MAMRYHWGLGIGHTYSHGQSCQSQQYSAPIPESDQEPEFPDLEEINEPNLEPEPVGLDLQLDEDAECGSAEDDSDSDSDCGSSSGSDNDSCHSESQSDSADEDMMELYDTYNSGN